MCVCLLFLTCETLNLSVFCWQTNWRCTKISLELVLSSEYLTQLLLYNWMYLCILMHEKHKRTKNKIRIKTINHFNRILSPARQVDACSSEDLKSCECEYEDQRERMRHLLATVLHDDSNITVKTSQIHRLSWAEGTEALSDTSTHRNLLVRNIHFCFSTRMFSFYMERSFFSWCYTY